MRLRFIALAVFFLCAMTASPVVADEFRAKRLRAAPAYTAMGYYAAYPWWWNDPVPRARTNYVKWVDTYYQRPYDAPHPDGVIGVTIFGPWW